MLTKPTLGKVDRKYLQRVIYRRLGAARHGILVGPKFGVDNAAVRVGRGNVLVMTTDPLSFIPAIGAKDSAWLSVNLLASDLTTSGFVPQYGIFDFNLPPAMKDAEFADYWKAFHAECNRQGVAIVGGHTGRYEGCDYTVIGGGVLAAIGPEDQYLTSMMAQNGDEIILTKGVAIETTAVLTRVFPKTVRKALGTKLFERAWQYLAKVSTVKDALTAVSVGRHHEGVTAMHDATEGGVIAAVLELANASGLGAVLDLESISISEETKCICDLFRIDPMISLSEGSLVIASKPHMTTRILNTLNSKGIDSQIIGRLTSKTLSSYAISRRGRTRVLYPKTDPYWKAYWKTVLKGWK